MRENTLHTDKTIPLTLEHHVNSARMKAFEEMADAGFNRGENR